MVCNSFLSHILSIALLTVIAPYTTYAQTKDTLQEDQTHSNTMINSLDKRDNLVEYFTAYTLNSGETSVGFDLDHGLTDEIMIGTDLLATVIGAPTIKSKWLVWSKTKDSISLGLSAAYLNEKTLLFGTIKDHFDTLDARIVRPSGSWSRIISPRLILHTFWAIGIGKVNATLSEKGRRKLWESKHPDGDYDNREQSSTNPSDNQEAQTGSDSFSQRSLQVQSLTGLLRDHFQVTGEFKRGPFKKILITSRIDRTEIEELKSNGFRITVAQQWTWDTFQFRLGIGLQYQVITGKDLDDEKIDEAGLLPATDINFYWRF